MNLLRTFKQRTKGFRVLLLGLLAAVISSLLVVAPAGAETADAASAPPVVETPAVAEQPVTSVRLATPEPSAPEPVQIQVTSASSPNAGGEESSVAPTPSERPDPVSNLPASTSTAVDSVADHVAPDSSAIASSADSVRTAVAGVHGPAHEAADAGAAAAPKHRLSELVSGIRRNSRGVAALVSDLLPAAQVGPALLPADLLNSLHPTIAAAAALVGQSPTGGELSPAAHGTMNFPELPEAGLFSNRGAAAPALFPGGYLAVAGKFEIGETPLWKSGGRSAARLPAASTAELAGTTIDHGRSSVPSDLPLPAPESPATAVADAGGPSFVPIAALLALLALVAPAALRRLGRAADFRSPNPFICALERPG